MFVLLFALGSDSVPPAAVPLVLLVGDASPALRSAYDRLMQVVAQTQPAMAAKARFVFWNLAPYERDPDAGMVAAMRERPDLLVALDGFFAAAARRHAGRTPLVFASYEDPLRSGIISSMDQRPEPVCGISMIDVLENKRLELLQQAFPRIRTVAVVADRAWADEFGGRERVERQARRLGLRASILIAQDIAQVRAVMRDPASRRFDAWYLTATQVTDEAEAVIIERMRAWHTPNIWATTGHVRRGGQLAYEQDADIVWTSIAELAARVLAGEPAGTLPILRPQRFRLVVRVDRDRDMPAPDIAVVRRADLVIR